MDKLGENLESRIGLFINFFIFLLKTLKLAKFYSICKNLDKNNVFLQKFLNFFFIFWKNLAYFFIFCNKKWAGSRPGPALGLWAGLPPFWAAARPGPHFFTPSGPGPARPGRAVTPLIKTHLKQLF